ncbi:hypothetical protein BDR07DRAFT_1486976 [Suillus spraguei]|nr:hypothetical protein BDR07DRAFT_1486976 [Suillus spraguei]
MDISIIKDNEVLMLVCSEDKRWRYDAEAAVIAGAIAAFTANNKVRVASDLPPLSATTIPAIAMNGSNPIFYKIPVTAELSEAVARGAYPTNETRVLRYAPLLRIPPMSGWSVHKHKPEVLADLEAFKQLKIQELSIVLDSPEEGFVLMIPVILVVGDIMRAVMPYSVLTF